MKRKIGSVRSEGKDDKRQRQKLESPADSAPRLNQREGEIHNQVRDIESVRRQAHPYWLCTARVPISALSSTWRDGTNRAVDVRHIQELCSMFLSGKLERTDEKNHLVVVSSSAEVERMKQHILDVDGALENETWDFARWPTVNESKIELLDGQHRVKALEEYIRHIGAPQDDAWWPCEFYNRGMFLPN